MIEIIGRFFVAYTMKLSKAFFQFETPLKAEREP